MTQSYSMSGADLKKIDDPVLVSSTDGVGPKLKVAFLMDRHDTVGIDCVAMCVDDIVCSGAEPLFFTYYISCARNIPVKTKAIISGISKGCRIADVSLRGGETVEMPGFYPDNEYDLVGFAVGLLDKAHCIDSGNVKAGGVLIGLGSKGVHCSGYSLIRRVLRLNEQCVQEYIQTLGATLGEELLKPTRIYAPAILKLKEKIPIQSLCHVAGGGFTENIQKMLPDGFGADIRRGAWVELPIFKLIQWEGDISDAEMFRAFNMGIGMIMAVSPEYADEALSLLKETGEDAYVIGEVRGGAGINIG